MMVDIEQARQLTLRGYTSALVAWLSTELAFKNDGPVLHYLHLSKAISNERYMLACDPCVDMYSTDIEFTSAIGYHERVTSAEGDIPVQ